MAKRLDEDNPELAVKIFKDLEPVWGCKPSAKDIQYYLRASVRMGAVGAALEWIELSAGSDADGFRNELLANCSRYKDGLAVVEQQGSTPKSESEYAHLLRLAAAEGLVEERTRLLEQMVQEGV